MMDFIDHSWPWFDTFFLAVLAAACVLHINESRHVWCLRLGYALVIGGAAASALEWWWPTASSTHWGEITLHAGLAGVAAGLTREQVRALLTKFWSYLWRLN
jgi:hypothetical protein